MDSAVDSSLQCILAVLAFLQDLKSVEMNEEHEDAEKQEDHKSRTTCTVIELPAAIVVESYGCRPWQNECKFCFMSLSRKVKVEALQLLQTSANTVYHTVHLEDLLLKKYKDMLCSMRAGPRTQSVHVGRLHLKDSET